LHFSQDPSLPLLSKPHDPLRGGLITLKDAAAAGHPVETIQKSLAANDPQTVMLQKVYGSALPARMHLERQLLNRVERLPGLPSSKLGLESLTGSLDDFSFASYLNLPHECEIASPEFHDVMERRLGINKK
jgi:proteasome maturation protein